ncbi:MAG: hypothetical protein ACPG06_07835 [Alphaproteobacteria bacterium]
MMKQKNMAANLMRSALIGGSLSVLTATAALAGAMPYGHSDNGGGYNPSSYQSP